MKALNELKKVLDQIKNTFVGKDEVVDLLGIALIAKENAFLYGPPGTAKSAIVRALSDRMSDGENFDYLLTRFTEPNEIFGPFDIRSLKEGDLVTNTQGMLPEASIIFLDEIFNANSAILNSLLTALNERIFRRGRETKKLPALMFVGASNNLPEDETLDALFDRFLVRIPCNYVVPEKLNQVLTAGWKLENLEEEAKINISVKDVISIQGAAKNVDISGIHESFINMVHSMRNVGVRISDRRAVKLQNLIAASAFYCGRDKALVSDLWVLKYVWDLEEQIEIVAGLVNALIENEEKENAHPQAFVRQTPNPEELVKEVDELTASWEAGKLSMQDKNIVKDKLRYVQSRAEWIQNKDQKDFIQGKIEKLWEQILQTVA